MNSLRTDIDKWFLDNNLIDDEALPEILEPVFDVDRQLVQSKIGPYLKLFLRPQVFRKRFYHRVYPLPVANWHILEQIKLYDDFCTIDITLEIQFQATLSYAQSCMEHLSDLNSHIKATYHELLINLIHKELQSLPDANWVQKGLGDLEHKISLAISEMLILHNIQSLTLCTLKPLFAGFPEVQLAKDSVYLCVLKKSYEFNEAKRQELFLQEYQFEKQKREHKQKLLDELNRRAELERQEQAQKALHAKRLLEEQEQYQLKQFELENRLHKEKLAHENKLNNLKLEADITERQKHEQILRQAEKQAHLEKLKHQTTLKEKELDAEIAQFEAKETKWLESRHKVYNQQLAAEQRKKQLELETQTQAEKRREQQRLDMQKESYKRRLESDEFLKKEIESLQLERQRLELQLAVNAVKRNSDGDK